MVVSPFAKAGYRNYAAHKSYVRTIQDTFGISQFLNDRRRGQ